MNWFFDRRPIVIFCPHTLTNYEYVGISKISNAREMVMNYIAETKNIRFIIKLHPSCDDRWYYKKWIKDNRLKNVNVIWKANTLKLIKKSDAVISQHSTVAIDAFALHKPSIVIEDEVSDCIDEFSEFKLAGANRAGMFFLREKKKLNIVIQACLFTGWC